MAGKAITPISRNSILAAFLAALAWTLIIAGSLTWELANAREQSSEFTRHAVAVSGGAGSISSIAPWLAAEQSAAHDLVVGYVSIWLIGFIGIGAICRCARACPRDLEITIALQGSKGKFNQISRTAENTLFEQKEFLNAILESGPECVKVISADGSLLQINRAGLAMLEVDTLEEAVEQGLLNFVQREYRNAFVQFSRRVLSGESGIMAFPIKGKQGTPRWLETHATPMRNAQEEIIALVGVTRDITEHRRMEERLRLSAKVFENSGEGIIITDAASRIMSVNHAFTGVTGYSAEEAIGQTPAILNSGRQNEGFFRDMWHDISQQDYWSGEIWNRRKNGEAYPEWLGVSVVRDVDNRVTHYVGIFSDISEIKKSEAKIEFLAYHDPLTELPNRLLARDHMELAMSSADRANSKATLLFLDIDNFKTINDSLGHAVGDTLLKAVAARLRECLRDTDTLSRQGGDEFLIVLPDVSDSDAIAGVAEKILTRMAASFHLGSHELSISLSVGLAVYPDDGRDFETLLKKADTAMYQAKEAGRNSYRFHTEQMNADAVEYLRIRNGLCQALEKGEFVLHYQPQVSLASGAVIGAEALIRWHHPELGLVPPGRFIRIAEESGLIEPIGKWVLLEACRQAAAWCKAGLPELVIAVNLSAVQFKRGDLMRSVAQALDDSGLDPALLELELTESILIQNTEQVLGTVQRLKTLGVKLSIDDFGTGYSSLSYLKRFNVDKLKIDQSFVRDMVNDPSDAAIIRAIIQMAKSLNLKTIAEGVEDKQTLDFLRLNHCDEAQGYHFARPIPADDFFAYVSEARAVCQENVDQFIA
ncbi:MAG: EAL domain-containing protein [Sulfuricella sp.]|nr:EAL domain-containing protein [Sulfuricella sp.]